MKVSSQTKTLAVLLIDRSTSMRKFAAGLREGFAGHVETLKASPEARGMELAVWSFAGRMATKALPPTQIALVGQMPELKFEAGTPLYTAVAQLLELLLRLPQDRELKVVLNVLTDGEDRDSHPLDLESLRSLLVPDALDRGFRLSVIGFGVDGVGIARSMGFAGETSAALPATVDGLHDSFRQITRNTIMRPATRK